ncbi:MAG TPA: signal peptide peptidase SppA [Candidatus Dormibacteraeota bacterium]|nr:signal peptide peptidase SppA [Candidatus Dormibacteraeota bacterium]
MTTTQRDTPPSDPLPRPPFPLDRLLAMLRRGRPMPAGRVAIVRLYGSIGGGARTADQIELIRRLRDSKRVPAVVVDVDSPGGSATASDDLFLALQRLAAKKPLVASIRGTGASGAYLAAMAARTVVAQPHAVVGSIGVISVGPRVARLFDRLGVEVSETKAGRLKGMGAPWREETDEERAKERELVDAFYTAFVQRVASGRGLPEERVRELATGEVWLGEQARDLGLIDEVGDLERAVEIAAQAAGVPPRLAVVHLRRRLLDRIFERFATQLGERIVDELETRLGHGLRT